MALRIGQGTIGADIDNPTRLVVPAAPVIVASKRKAGPSVTKGLSVFLRTQLATDRAAASRIERGISHLISQSFEQVPDAVSVLE